MRGDPDARVPFNLPTRKSYGSSRDHLHGVFLNVGWCVCDVTGTLYLRRMGPIRRGSGGIG